MMMSVAYDRAVAGTEIIPADEAPPSSVWRDPLEGTPFRTLGELGRGGGGEVVLAEHRKLGTVHAVKLLLLSGMNDPQLWRRLELEGQALARLKHPNLVDVTHLDATPVGRPFLVMEHLVGETVHDRLERADGGPLELDEILFVAEGVCRGLSVLHERGGIIHRDLKPSNVFLVRDGSQYGQVKVLDLGLAKVIVELASTGAPSPPSMLTATGVILGTPRYMSPEQISGEPVGPQSDLYALGALMYRGVTGRGPFDYVKGWDAVLAAHILDPPAPPSSHLSTPLPNGLDEIILRCLAKKPEDRFESAEALARALAEVRTSLAASDVFGPGYVTQPMLPSTVMMEPELRADPSHLIMVPRAPGSTPAERPKGISWRAFGWLLAGAILLGAILGGLIVGGMD